MSNNHKGRRTTAQSMEPDAELRRRLEEAEQTLEAIRHGDVDGLVVAGPQGEQVYSLAGAEHVYRVIVETMNEAALTVDSNGAILFCNRRFCELMRTSIQKAMGHKVTAFAAPPQQFSLQKLLTETHLGPVQRRLLLRAADGTPVPVQLAASPLAVGGHPSICLVASDLTELEASARSIRSLREYQQALEESEARWALELAATQQLQEISTQLIQEEDAEAMYDRILDAAVAIMRSDFASFQVFHPERGPDGELQLLGHRGFTPEAAQFWEWVRPASETTCGLALRTKQRVITPDVQSLDFTPGIADRKIFLQTGIRAVQTTPLILRSGRLVGMISTHWRQPHRPTERDLRALDVLARQAADLLEHRQAQEALQAANENLRAQTEQLRTVIDLLQAKQHELEQANDNLQMQEQDLRQHAEDLQTGRERLALAASGTRLGMYEWNVVTGETLWTEQVARLLGLRTTTATTTTTTTISLHYHYQDWAERVHPEDLPRVETELQRCMAERAPYEAEYRVIWPEGSVHWLADRGVFQYESDGPCTRMLGILLDITERQRSEELLQIKERAIASSLNALAMADPQGRLTYVNPAFLKLWGYEEEGEVLGKSVLDFWKDPRQARAVMQAIRNGAGWVGELAAARKDGACPNLYVSASAVLNEAGAPTCMTASFLDITERRQAEEALRELNATLESRVARRTAELEQRARQLQKLTLELSQAEERERRRIALLLHEDLQQQIAGARFHLNLLKGPWKPEAAQETVARVEEILNEAIGKSRRLSHDLSPAVLHLNDLQEVLQWLAGRVQAQHGLMVHVDVSGEMTLPSEAMTMFLFRTAQELLGNVVQHAGVNEAALRVRRRGRYVGLRVSDQGRGFDPQELRRTTGFGLLSIRERVELLGGRMKIKSVRGRGSTFSIVVPNGEKPENEERAVEEASPGSGLPRP